MARWSFRDHAGVEAISLGRVFPNAYASSKRRYYCSSLYLELRPDGSQHARGAPCNVAILFRTNMSLVSRGTIRMLPGVPVGRVLTSLSAESCHRAYAAALCASRRAEQA